MISIKKIGSLILAFTLVITPAMINADEYKQVIDDGVNAVEVEEYMTYEGNIVDVNKVDGNISIWVKKAEEENPQEDIVFHINDDLLLLSDKTMDRVEKTYLEEDMKVLVFYKANTPMTMSLPGQMTPHGIIVRENENLRSVKLSNFNHELVSLDNQLKLNIQKDTPMLDEDGEKVEVEDLKGENLLVFYSVTTRSIPAQTSPQAVILLDDMNMDWDFGQDLNVFHKISIERDDGELDEDEYLELKLTNEIYKNDENVLMIPLREVGMALGYEVTWDAEKRAAQLVKGAQWTEVIIGEGTVGEDNYSFAKMIVKLGTPPVLKKSTAYVPVNFLEEVLQMDISVEDGILVIEE